ncbi:phage integrase family protein [Lyngbya aestuarii BL J]|uniref:Phage integrase family protein n=1 Tax=Lyngbya aestuarii BL J TaxID=1348334 RepID=U7QQN0_9CYAN|nr:phage integrase family protein [Lyngbya aestuarii BL J]
MCQELKLQSPSTSQHSREITIPTSEEIQRYYQAIENNSTVQERVILKTLLYTGIRLGELVNIQLTDIDFDSQQILIRSERGQDRIVLFPVNFKDLLAMQADPMSQQQATYLFESPQHHKCPV